MAFQGEHGAYSEEAIIKRFGERVDAVPRPFLRDVFESVEGGGVDLGLVPVENTLEGSVVQTYDLLLESPLTIVGETILRVVHCLIANPGVSMDEIKRVYSHPQALGQCRAFLERHGFESVPHYDTAGSVKMLGEGGLRDAGAIASRRAAEVYGMEVLAAGIETHPENYTRFFMIGRDSFEPSGRFKTSVAYIVDHSPGTLYRSLGPFAEQSVNLMKIESRPIVGRPWEYTFFVEVEGHRDDPKVRRALESLRERTNFMKILGSYPGAGGVGR